MDSPQINIILIFNYGYHWISRGGVHVKGYGFENDNYLEGESLCAYFLNIKDQQEFIKKIISLNGCFSVIIEKEDVVWAAVDRIRMFPLFYFRKDNILWLSDDVETITREAGNVKLDDVSISEFLATGVVPGAYTLALDVFQIPTGNHLWINKKSLDVNTDMYFTYATKIIRDIKYNEARNELIEKFKSNFKRLFDSLRNKNIAIPLSGGFDSRFIAVMCKEFGVKNVICFTFGKKENPEVAYSESVAKKLGFKWLFIEYTPELIDSYYNSEVFHNYYRFAANYSSQFMMQQYFAIKYIKETLKFSEDTVFLPGFAGDVLGGSHITKYRLKNEMNIEKIHKRLYVNQFNLICPKRKYKGNILKRINNTIIKNKAHYIPYSVYEDWDFKEKQSKFIVNSAKAYSFFGYQYRFPFLDNDLVEFFKSLPLQYKMNRVLYFDVLQNYFFKKYSLNLSEEFQPNPWVYKFQYFKDRVKTFLPEFFKRKLYGYADNMNYSYITQFMVNDMKEKKMPINTNVKYKNSIISQWYINNIRNKDFIK